MQEAILNDRIGGSRSRHMRPVAYEKLLVCGIDVIFGSRISKLCIRAAETTWPVQVFRGNYGLQLNLHTPLAV